MARTMQHLKTEEKFDVVCWMMHMGSGWEFYLLEFPDERGFCKAYVCGVEDEFGDVEVRDITPCYTVKQDHPEFNDVMPPPGFKWVTDV